MSNIRGGEHCCRIVRINIAYELSLHLEGSVLLSPILKCKVHCARSQITSAYAYLYNGRELLARCICNLSIMNLIGKICDSVLLLNIEASLVNSVSLNRCTKLTSCHVVKNKTLLTRIYNLSLVESLELL